MKSTLSIKKGTPVSVIIAQLALLKLMQVNRVSIIVSR
jgi:hypothetical protein